MRVYQDMTECFNESIREVFSRGQIVFDKTVQGKVVERADYEAKEILNYSFVILNIDDESVMTGLDWMRSITGKDYHSFMTAKRWFETFLDGSDNWWQTTELAKYWSTFGNDFSYTYGQRLSQSVQKIIRKLNHNLYGRGAFLSVWSKTEDEDHFLQGKRIPCTIGYQFLVRKAGGVDKLYCYVCQRSCDLVNFFCLDVAKAALLQRYIAEKLGVEVGHLVFNITSLHAYKIDVPEGRKW
jgi:thymidylate synthase